MLLVHSICSCWANGTSHGSLWFVLGVHHCLCGLYWVYTTVNHSHDSSGSNGRELRCAFCHLRSCVKQFKQRAITDRWTHGNTNESYMCKIPKLRPKKVSSETRRTDTTKRIYSLLRSGQKWKQDCDWLRQHRDPSCNKSHLVEMVIPEYMWWQTLLCVGVVNIIRIFVGLKN